MKNRSNTLLGHYRISSCIKALNRLAAKNKDIEKNTKSIEFKSGLRIVREAMNIEVKPLLSINFKLTLQREPPPPETL